MTMTPRCHLCSQIAGDREGDLISQLLAEAGYVRRVPIETTHFAAVPSLGPLVPGHTLLCPRLHSKSLAQVVVTACEPDVVLADFGRLKGQLANTLRLLYGAPVHCFEHSTGANDCRVLCTVEHAHLHLLPAAVDLLSILSDDRRWRGVRANLSEVASLAGSSEYLYYESPDGVAMIATSANGFESQYMRRVFASRLGMPNEWDWRDSPRAADADSLFQALRSP